MLDMHTKLLMQASAFAMLLVGLGLTFAPRELLLRVGGGYPPVMVLLLQATGALYLGFAVLNWMAKDNLIGGIYSKPVGLGNFLHFFMVAMALVKALSAGSPQPGMIGAALVYIVFAVWFGLVVFGSPIRSKA
jgi:hypothetical protein